MSGSPKHQHNILLLHFISIFFQKESTGQQAKPTKRPFLKQVADNTYFVAPVFLEVEDAGMLR